MGRDPFRYDSDDDDKHDETHVEARIQQEVEKRIVRQSDSVTGFPTMVPSMAPSESPSFSPIPLLDSFVEALRSWIAPTKDELMPLKDPTSTQSQALMWLQSDPITLTPGGLTRTVIQRYVLAVLCFSTSRPSWEIDYLSPNDVCAWNDGFPPSSEAGGSMECSCHNDDRIP